MHDPQFWMGVLAIAAPLLFYFGFRNWRVARLIDDTPVSRVRSAAQGYVELSGIAKLPDGKPNLAPLTKIPCVWWRYQVEQRSGEGKDTRWQTINSGTSVVPFKLEDDTGVCLVGPASADVRPSKKSSWYGSEALPSVLRSGSGDYRYTEYRIHENEQVSVIGDYRTFGSAGSGEATAEVARLLSEWKQDQPALLQRFDTNRDGILSQAEWERARAAAREQIDDQRAHSPSASLSIVVQPQDGRPFLLAACDLKKLARRSRWAAGLMVLGFVVAVAALASMVF